MTEPLTIPPRKNPHRFHPDRKEPITHEQATESLVRLIHSHFGQTPHARMTIPARADDDDVLLSDYIAQQREKDLL